MVRVDRMNMMKIIYLLLLIEYLSSEQMLTRNIGQDVIFSCLFANQSQYEQVRFENEKNFPVNRA